jgi:hypothetical protein
MSWDTFANVILLIAVALICLYGIITIILQAESNIIFWMMRPSEKAAMDIVGIVTALGGTTGEITTTYETEMYGNEYYLINSGKITCVITKKTQAAPGVMGGEMTTINCYSAPIDATINQRRMATTVPVKFEKYYDDGLVIKEVT